MLIVIRGTSGSGKSTLAAQLQQKLGWPTAGLGQEHLRRTVYRKRQDAGHADGMEHAALLEVAATHCFAVGHDVALEGIFQADRYSTMRERLASPADDARFYAFDLSFGETARRHERRPKASEVSSVQMRQWYLGWDPLPFVAERRILPGEESSVVVQRLLGSR
ncbi:AAA family ATPase [Curtobacterium sp. VKM Ac-1393]|uniref:AAA family ATPase n=1 Tax=Curtobacterium sp. VKM Ac-1393 TaxID=2783814 RepID=UPI00188B8933|nr:AAA family ATPase [Curtobacterium sp. VKM Ac-1393]MBF4609476.1 kinase [Curtobacterium sp. VKM Ac-1393]